MKSNYGRDGMKLKNVFYITAMLLMTWLPKSAPAADFEGSVEIGAARVDTDRQSSKFMEYGGIKGDNTYFLGDVDLSYSNRAYYLELDGKNLGLDSRNILVESGSYGKYRFFFEYDQIPKFISNTSRTIFDGAGDDNLTLPSGYVGNGSNVNPKTLVDQIINGTNGIGGSGNLRDADLELLRKSGTAGFSLTKGPVDFNLSFKREEKEGTKSIGAVVQDSILFRGGPRSTVILPEPVDYTTDDLRASVGYNREKAQIELAYYLSIFNNDDESLKWQNPYYYGAPNPVISLPPDNEYHKFTLSGGLNLPMSTRITAVAEYGKMTQDENFLPYHANPASTANDPSNFPRTSADAEIETKLVNVNLSSRPVSGLGLNARYRHYETINNTPVDLFRYPVADGQNSVTVRTTTVGPAGSIYADGTSAVGKPCTAANPCYSGFTSAIQGQAALNTAQARYNQPFDYKQDLVKADVSYLVLRNTTLSAGYDREVIHRDLREADETTENSYRAGISTNISSYAAAGGNYLTGHRRYDDYNGAVILDSFTQDYRDVLNSGANPRTWINNPDLRKFDVANRDRKQYSAFANLFPLDSVTLGVNYSLGKDDYPDTVLGLTESNSEVYTVDATITPAETVTVYSYYTNERLRSKQVGRDMTDTASTWFDLTRDWTSTNKDSVNTVGLGLNLSFLKGRLNITPDYTYARTQTKIDIWGGSALTVAPFPDLKTERHTFNLSGKYKLTDNWTLGAGYLYETYVSDDWATDNMTLDNTATLPTNLLILSESVPDYTAHAGSITVAYRW